MSKVADIINSNQSQQCTHIFFDPDSIDSLLGAAILKYACEEITNVTETLLIQPINTVNNQSYAIDETPTDKNITFVGCVPDKEMLSYLVSLHKKNLLFVLSDEDLYNEVRNCGASIEYSTEDSCALLLYKIVFGELNDGIPNIIKIVSKGVMKQYDGDYETYLRFFYGFALKYLPIADYIRLNSIYDDIKPALFKKTTTYDETQIMNSCLDVLNGMNQALGLQMNGIKSDKWIVNGSAEGYAFFGNGPMLPTNINGISIVNYFPLNVLISFYRKNKNFWVVELFKSVSTDKIEQRDRNAARISEIETALANNEIVDATSYTTSYAYSYTSNTNQKLSDTEVSLLNNEKKQLIAENNVLNSVIDFDCAQYLKKYYGGGGTEQHGAAKIATKAFIKMIEKRTI